MNLSPYKIRVQKYKEGRGQGHFEEKNYKKKPFCPDGFPKCTYYRYKANVANRQLASICRYSINFKFTKLCTLIRVHRILHTKLCTLYCAH